VHGRSHWEAMVREGSSPGSSPDVLSPTTATSMLKPVDLADSPDLRLDQEAVGFLVPVRGAVLQLKHFDRYRKRDAQVFPAEPDDRGKASACLQRLGICDLGTVGFTVLSYLEDYSKLPYSEKKNKPRPASYASR